MNTKNDSSQTMLRRLLTSLPNWRLIFASVGMEIIPHALGGWT